MKDLEDEVLWLPRMFVAGALWNLCLTIAQASIKEENLVVFIIAACLGAFPFIYWIKGLIESFK